MIKLPKQSLIILRKLSVMALGIASSFAAIAANPVQSEAAVISGNGRSLAGGARWDADPRQIGGNERSLNGGLRYSLQGGSYQAYRDLFAWIKLPSVDDFQKAIDNAFNAWTVKDPASKLGTDLSFVADLKTPVAGKRGGGINPDGAEIDLLAATDALSWNPGADGTVAETFFDIQKNTTVTLTSGTKNYKGDAISGADITFNTNPQARYTLDLFQTLLTHEIGHSIGLLDVELASNIFDNVFFIDDNFDGKNAKTVKKTLTNSWAKLVDPDDPSKSKLGLFKVRNGDPGLDTPGVDILMESNFSRALIGKANPLQNDDYGGRQFLYPKKAAVPEPLTILGAATALGFGAFFKRKLAKKISKKAARK